MASKRYKKAIALVDAAKNYPLNQAVDVLGKFPKAKFVETVDLAFRLGVDPKQSDQMVRGTCPLPHGSGKTVRVLVFTKAGAQVAPEADIQLLQPDHPYVGRGGLKLAHALDTFHIAVEGRQALDIGASTPPEIAASVLAEIIRHLRGARGKGAA